MNRALPEMLQPHCLNSPEVPGNCTDMTVLERQRARLKWQQDQLQQQSNYFNENELINGLFYNPDGSQAGQVSGFMGMIGALKPDPGLENGWPEMDRFDVPGMGYGLQMAANNISRTSSCPPALDPVTADVKLREGFSPEKISSAAGRESFKKRKAEKLNNTKVVQEDDSREKKAKGSSEGESKVTEQNSPNNNDNNKRENSVDTSTKENSKASEVQKPDYIHVRARRGQATDSHSLAERVRREKISERMKYLQDLVPGCNKITGKAGMLDEIINYVQSLQRQVEFLSMKLAAVNPRLDFSIDDLFAKEMFPACAAGLGISSAEMSNSAYHVQYNPAQQIVSCGDLEMGLTSQDMALRRTISAPISIPDQAFLDNSCYTQQIQPQLPTWDSEFLNLFSAFPAQPFAGSVEASNLKMEM